MASDRGSSGDLAAGALDAAWFAGAAWLHVSGYLLSSDAGARAALEAARIARGAGARVSLDTASATLIETTGAAFGDRVAAVAPDVLFATTSEHAALDGAGSAPTVVVKRGAGGCSVLRDGTWSEHGAARAEAVDATGAGDAFAAGWLLGDVSLALEAGARCVSAPGAMP